MGSSPPRTRLAALAAEIVECRACPRLVEWRESVAMTKRAAFRDDDYWARPVPGFGDPAARLIIVGLAPAAHGANRTGRIFTGDRSGDFLFAALHRTGYASQPVSRHRDDGLVLTDAYITCPVRCAPPANRPTPEERRRCRPFLDRELTLLSEARVYLTLGALGFDETLDALDIPRAGRPRFGHGATLTLPGGRTVLASFHVSQQNTFTGRLTPEMFDDVLSRARTLSEP